MMINMNHLFFKFRKREREKKIIKVFSSEFK